MKRAETDYARRAAERRKLRIYATDPMSGRRAPYRISIEVENEIGLAPGPSGETIEVIDYDGWNKTFYSPVDLNETALLMEDGLAQSESDPRFHQQMVYAVAMRVIESARRALGRPLTFQRGDQKKLRLFPHAFFGRNAFFDPELNAILFGYFQADSVSPGLNIPGQAIYTCLSHDIIAHEMTHAIVHRLRPYFLEPSNLDVLAFHEAFSDIVALFLRFSYRDLLAEHIQNSQNDLRKADMLVELAQQFGQATGSGKALRSALGSPPHKLRLSRVEEPHDRGSILVSAVFDGFFRAFRSRTADLLRIATGGSGELPRGRLHPDLVNRLATEAAQLADRFLRICFRAFDYMPPVDVTFGDFLRALVTSDYELNPADADEVRYAIIEGFRERGIFPAGVKSLAEESLLWPSQLSGALPIPPLPHDVLEDARRFLNYSATALDQARPSRRSSRRASEHSATAYESVVIDAVSQTAYPGLSLAGTDSEKLRDRLFSRLHDYALAHAAAFGLDTRKPIAVAGFHAVHRIAADQRLVIEFVGQFTQVDEDFRVRLAGIPFRGGCTAIFGSEGEVRYIACKPLHTATSSDQLAAEGRARLAAAEATVEALDRSDPRMAFADPDYLRDRMKLRARFRALHGEV